MLKSSSFFVAERRGEKKTQASFARYHTDWGGTEVEYSATLKKQISLDEYPSFVLLDDRTMEKMYVISDFINVCDDDAPYEDYLIGDIVTEEKFIDISSAFSEAFRFVKEGDVYVPVALSSDDMMI